MFNYLLTQTIVRDNIKSERGGIKMKDLLKSKVMMGFIVFVLGVTYFDSMQHIKMEEKIEEYTKSDIVYNLK